MMKFDLITIEEFEISHPDLRSVKDISGAPQKGKKPRQSQMHKETCRIIAKDLWKKDPKKTIQDVILSDELNAVCEGIPYTERTLRDWVKDLCPNPKPGRPKR